MESTAAQLRQLLESQRFAVLATEAARQPYTSLMAFASTDDLGALVIITERETHKFANLQSNPRTALLIDDRTNSDTDMQTGTAVTVVGHATEAYGRERQSLLEIFTKKHPVMTDFARSPSCAILRVDVDTYHIVTRFQDVAMWRPGQ